MILDYKQFTGDNAEVIFEWADNIEMLPRTEMWEENGVFHVKDPYKPVEKAVIGDYIIVDEDKDFHVCKQSIFEGGIKWGEKS